MDKMQSLIMNLKGQFMVAFIYWLCGEMIGNITVEFTPEETAELLQLLILEGHMIEEEREEGVCHPDDENAFDRYGRIFDKIVGAVYADELGVKMMMVEEED